jgi:hypothetical protein
MLGKDYAEPGEISDAWSCVSIIVRQPIRSHLKSSGSFEWRGVGEMAWDTAGKPRKKSGADVGLRGAEM